MDDQDIMRRAMAAYFKSGAIDQPASSISQVESIGELHYAVLRNGGGTLAVYRVRNDGMLKRLKRWPKEITD